MKENAPESRTTRPVVPDSGSKVSKKGQVAEMFNDIAGKYDFLNHFLSMGIDKGWRKKAIRIIAAGAPKRILDVATGTGDLAITANKYLPEANITGVDISEGMLSVGHKKLNDLRLTDRIQLQLADSEAMPFGDQQFDAVMCAYGVRNFENLEQGLREMHRVLSPGGRFAILEFSKPKKFPVAQLYQFYFSAILPTIGKIVSRHSKAYTYLPESVAAFPEGEEFCSLLKKCGFKDVKARPLTFGITTLYSAVR